MSVIPSRTTLLDAAFFSRPFPLETDEFA